MFKLFLVILKNNENHALKEHSCPRNAQSSSDVHNKQSSDNILLCRTSGLKFLVEIIHWTTSVKYSCGSLPFLN